MKQFIQFIFKNQEKILFLFYDNFNIVLTFQRWFIDNQHIATIFCDRDSNPVDTKACTALIKRIFYASNLLWQCAWENRKVRRFFRSGSSNLAYAVALLFRTNGGS
uniref:VapH protein n=1 Tax=Dichelobacter nodosus TaxID=870 RepID=Q9RM55_DICNO|nr:VapH protein [Dichelobacter nodosus]